MNFLVQKSIFLSLLKLSLSWQSKTRHDNIIRLTRNEKLHSLNQLVMWPLNLELLVNIPLIVGYYFFGTCQTGNSHRWAVERLNSAKIPFNIPTTNLRCLGDGFHLFVDSAPDKQYLVCGKNHDCEKNITVALMVILRYKCVKRIQTFPLIL